MAMRVVSGNTCLTVDSADGSPYSNASVVVFGCDAICASVRAPPYSAASTGTPGHNSRRAVAAKAIAFDATGTIRSIWRLRYLSRMAAPNSRSCSASWKRSASRYSKYHAGALPVRSSTTSFIASVISWIHDWDGSSEKTTRICGLWVRGSSDAGAAAAAQHAARMTHASAESVRRAVMTIGVEAASERHHRVAARTTRCDTAGIERVMS